MTRREFVAGVGAALEHGDDDNFRANDFGNGGQRPAEGEPRQNASGQGKREHARIEQSSPGEGNCLRSFPACPRVAPGGT